MKIKEEALEVLQKTGEILKEPEFAESIQHAISSKVDMTWLEVANIVLPMAIDSVENSKVKMSSNAKNKLVTDLILPLIKDKLPWYAKPFAAKLIGWAIDLIVGALNKLFTKKWKKEVVETNVKAEGTI